MPEYPIGETHTRELTQARFPCRQCGAVLNYAVGTRHLECQHCGHRNQIEDATDAIRELDLGRALRELQNSRRANLETSILTCPNCAAEFALDSHVHSGECPFCGTNVVTGTGPSRKIKPKGLLPFRINARQAREAYTRWLGGLWFAPGELKKFARADAGLNGV